MFGVRDGGEPGYELAAIDMQVEGDSTTPMLPPSRPPPFVYRAQYASSIVAQHIRDSNADDDTASVSSVDVYTAPAPAYGELVVSDATSATGYGTPSHAAAAYGETRLVASEPQHNDDDTPTSKQPRQSAQF